MKNKWFVQFLWADTIQSQYQVWTEVKIPNSSFIFDNTDYKIWQTWDHYWWNEENHPELFKQIMEYEE